VVPIQVSGGGAFTALNVTGESNPIVIQLSSEATGTTLPSGGVYAVTATAMIDGAPAEGVGISFAVISSTLSPAPVVAPSSSTTDASGQAQSTIVIPVGAQILIEATISNVNIGQSILIRG